MLTSNKRGRVNKQLKEHGFNFSERRAILSSLERDLNKHLIAANEVSLGYFEVAEDGRSAVMCHDLDNLDALYCFVSKRFDNGWQYIGYPNLMKRGY